MSGLVWSGWSTKSGFVSFINTQTHTHVCTNAHLADSSVVKGVQVNAQEGARDRGSEPRGERTPGGETGKLRKIKTVSL